MCKKLLLITLAGIFCFGTAAAQTSSEIPDEQTFIFRFTPGDDMFYALRSGNGEVLDNLLAGLALRKQALDNGQMYISVSSYAASSGNNITAGRMGYLHNSRVKSELITRAGVTEQMFVTDLVFTEPYGEEKLRDVVVVTYPASVEKVRQLAGDEAAAKVEAYNRMMAEMGQTVKPSCCMEIECDKEMCKCAEEGCDCGKDACVCECCSQIKAEPQPEPMEMVVIETRVEPEPQPFQIIEQPSAEQDKPYCIAVRTNLLYDVVLLPTLGVEWRATRDIGVKLDAGVSFWGNGSDKVQKIWFFNPEIRWYLLGDKRFYVGASGNCSKFNINKYIIGGIASKENGYQGNIWNAGVTVGYQLYLTPDLSLDFNLGLGYSCLNYDSFQVIEGGRTLNKMYRNTGFFGPTQAGVNLIWTIGKK